MAFILNGHDYTNFKLRAIYNITARFLAQDLSTAVFTTFTLQTVTFRSRVTLVSQLSAAVITIKLFGTTSPGKHCSIYLYIASHSFILVCLLKFPRIAEFCLFIFVVTTLYARSILLLVFFLFLWSYFVRPLGSVRISLLTDQEAPGLVPASALAFFSSGELFHGMCGVNV